MTNHTDTATALALGLAHCGERCQCTASERDWHVVNRTRHGMWHLRQTTARQANTVPIRVR